MMANKKTAPTNVTVELLKKNYPNAHCELNFQTPFQLLVATILSAQCTDVRVNMVTKVLFAEFPDAESLAKAKLSQIEKIIRSTGFFKNKAKNIIASAKILVSQYGGKVPQTLDQLIHLPGVGRKTANVVLGNAYQITSGVVVDTHVARLSFRFGWTKSKNPELIERELVTRIDKSDWILISHLLIWHGRSVCKARNPGCKTCFLFDHCPKIGV